MRLKVPYDFRGIPIERMLEGKSGLLGPDAMLKVKSQVYESLVDYLEVLGYPIEGGPDFQTANINDLVGHTIFPILTLFKRETLRHIYLTREKVITSRGSGTGGREEFVMMDYISLFGTRYIVVVESTWLLQGKAFKHCFLAMKNMREYNCGGTVYGFVTNGDYWRMISYDGELTMSEKMVVLLETMCEDKEQWMANNSILVDCLNVALSHGAKDPVLLV
ncbi:hypothetical protein HOY82DRAFT_651118 [Tuber indicum]|nr:hypothetical protein HOY82DRAFT_651118 [Tuber indicum]